MSKYTQSCIYSGFGIDELSIIIVRCIQLIISYLTKPEDSFVVEKYYQKMINAKKEKDKKYFESGINMLLTEGETISNFHSVSNEYHDVLKAKQTAIQKLHDEIKIIKRLKV